MSRYYARDIINIIKTKLTTDLPTMIGTINTERTDTTPLPVNITDKWNENQFPEVFIDITDTKIEYELLNSSVDQAKETFNMQITASIKDNSIYLPQWIENYIEAIYRVLQNYNDDNILWVLATETLREGIQTVENMTLKKGGVSFEVRIN